MKKVSLHRKEKKSDYDVPFQFIKDCLTAVL